MSAMDILRQNNGLKTTNTVLVKQQSGLDAAQKANPQDAAAQMNTNTAQAMLHGKGDTLTPPQDAHGQAVRMNQQTAEGMLHGEIPIVKKEEPKAEAPKQPEKPKQMSYADMFKLLNPESNETPEQKARREKRERRNMRIAAFGDGLRALSNMVFATQGARVIHNPQTDLSAVQLKRKQMIDAQREKNKAAWLNGYQKALALDEEARKNDNTLTEQMRYHDIIAKNNEDKNDLSQQRIDLSRYRINTLKDYNDRKLQIDKDYKDGMLSEKARSNAIAQLNADANMLRAQKSGNGRSSSNRYSGNTETYVTLKQTDPKGMQAAEEEAANMGYNPTTASGRAAVRVIYERKHNKGNNAKVASNGGKKPSTNGGSSKGGGKHSNLNKLMSKWK